MSFLRLPPSLTTPESFGEAGCTATLRNRCRRADETGTRKVHIPCGLREKTGDAANFFAWIPHQMRRSP